ncbi:hypothetical protein Tco_0576129 [Tanacetum coccineum]
MGEADVILGIKIKRENKGIVITQSYYIEKILKKCNREDCSPVSTPMDPVEKLKPNTGKPVDRLEADVILGIKIKRENKGIVITQSHYIEKVLKKFNREDCSMMCTPMDPIEKLMPNTGKPVDQLEYSRAIGCLMYTMTSTRPDIAYAVGRLSRFTSNPIRRNALAATGKEAEWLRNLIHEIPIWPKPIAPISIHCDSAATLAKAYSKIYNGKSRHLGVRHNMIRELIMNGVISIEFVQSQHNLADHLTKALARDLVIKSVIGMGLKSI